MHKFFSPTNLVWIDMEMSGLDIDKDRILQIACVITDSDLNIIATSQEFVIHQEKSILQSMDDWNSTHHSQSGLLKKVAESRLTEENSEKELIHFIGQYVPPKTSPLCGNSVYNDRRFIIKYLPNLDQFLHYRIIDVSTLKELNRIWYPQMEAFVKKDSHLALEDVKESIEELKFYRKTIFKSIT